MSLAKSFLLFDPFESVLQIKRHIVDTLVDRNSKHVRFYHSFNKYQENFNFFIR